MNREILFRGKPMFREGNEFVYGYYKQGDIAGVKTDFIIPLPEYKNEINEVAVCPQTVGQFTGLIDKNGVKIFEGDILKFKSGNYVVKWCNEHSKFLQADKQFTRELHCCIDDSEVIGNIHGS